MFDQLQIRSALLRTQRRLDAQHLALERLPFGDHRAELAAVQGLVRARAQPETLCIDQLRLTPCSELTVASHELCDSARLRAPERRARPLLWIARERIQCHRLRVPRLLHEE